MQYIRFLIKFKYTGVLTNDKHIVLSFSITTIFNTTTLKRKGDKVIAWKSGWSWMMKLPLLLLLFWNALQNTFVYAFFKNRFM